MTIPTGATGDPTAYELRGTGMPNGVVTASPGTYYTDTAGTCGAWRWLKVTGAGNTGWTVAYGDTGWRDVTASLVDGTRWNNVKGILNYARVRREGATVFLQVYLARTAVGARASANEGVIFTLPQGFESVGYGTKGDTVITTGGVMYLASSASINAAAVGSTPNTAPGAWVVGDSVRISGSFATPNAWPATLPGIPA
jgi:hypothetical protein